MNNKDAFDRAVERKFKDIQTAISGVWKIYASPTNDIQRREAETRILSRCEELASILSKEDQPAWLGPVMVAAKNACAGGSKTLGEALLSEIAKNYQQMKPIRFDEPLNVIGYDFDAIFSNLMSKSNLPELFSQMIDGVEQILDSGEIDSVTALTALQRLLDLLKANQDGSLVAVKQTIQVAAFVRNTTFAFLKRIPLAGAIAEGLEKTIEQSEKSLEEVEKDLNSQSLRMVLEQDQMKKLLMLSDHQPLPRIEENRTSETHDLH